MAASEERTWLLLVCLEPCTTKFPIARLALSLSLSLLSAFRASKVLRNLGNAEPANRTMLCGKDVCERRHESYQRTADREGRRKPG